MKRRKAKKLILMLTKPSRFHLEVYNGVHSCDKTRLSGPTLQSYIRSSILPVQLCEQSDLLIYKTVTPSTSQVDISSIIDSHSIRAHSQESLLIDE